MLRLRSRPGPPFHAASRVLAIAPHPDDLELGCGGSLRHWTLAGHLVDVLVITDGAATAWSGDQLDAGSLRAVRRAEALAGMTALGINPERAEFLDVADGTLATLTTPERSQLVERLAEILAASLPDWVVLPSGDDLSTEHDVVNMLLREAHRRAGSAARILEFPIWSWWNPIPTLRGAFRGPPIWRSHVAPFLREKELAIRCHRTQVGPVNDSGNPPLTSAFVQSFLRTHEYFSEFRSD